MSILPTSNIRRYDDVEELVDISVSLPLFTTDTLAVYYGEAGLDAIENVDYEIILNETDYSNFTFRPLASLITKINAQIVAEPTDRNTILLVRILPAETDAEPASVRSTQFVSKEFDRIAMRFQQLDEQISRAVLLSILNEDNTYDLTLPPWRAGKALAWHLTDKKLVTTDDSVFQGIQGPQGDPGVVQSLVEGPGITINSTDPAHPIISGGVVDGDKGDIVVTGAGSSWNIDSGVLSAFWRSVINITTASVSWLALLVLGHLTTRTALRALTPSVGMSVYVSEDGREGTFVWRLGNFTARVAADTLEGVYVKATSVSAATGCWVRTDVTNLNVRWFGAKGDAATDDYAAINAAMTLSKTLLLAVYLPGGKYRITNTLNWGVLSDHVYMSGDGRYKSQLLCDFATAREGIVVNTLASFSGYECTMHDFGITGVANLATSIYVMRVGNVDITNVWVNNGVQGIVLDGAFGFKLTRNKVQNMSVLGYNCINSAANNGRFEANGAYTTVIGVSVNACDNVTFTNNEIADCTSVGLQFTGVKSMDLQGNYIENNLVNIYMGGGNNHSVNISGANWFGASTNLNVIEGVDGFAMENNVLFNCAWTRNQATAKNVHAENNYLTGTATFPAIDIVPKMMESVLLGNFTGADVNTAQPVFAAAQDTLSIETDTTYEFEAEYFITRAAGTTSHTTAVLFGGTATFDAIRYVADVSNPTGNVLGAVSRIRGDGATALTLTAANTSATENLSITLKGRIRTNVGGTLIPQFQFSAAPGGAPTVQSGSAFRIWPIGNDQVTAIGPWA